jgi:hypothetical protein
MAVGVDEPRGTALLLAHCEVLEQLGADRPGGYERLVEEIGDRLARLLVFALAGGGRRPRACC